jgi:PKD repeat protein
VAVYTGGDLGSLSEAGCVNYGSPLTFRANAGTTYFFQVGGLFGQSGVLTFNLDTAPAPQPSFAFYPSDPSMFDTVQFYDQSYDPAQVGFQTEEWDFGDGTSTSNPGCCPTHRYPSDGDYTVQLTTTTSDGRTASVQQRVQVKTHDVAISKVTVPQVAKIGQTSSITVGLTNVRYTETVEVQLLKSVVGGGWQQVGVLTQNVPVRKGGTTSFKFNYTFAPEDGALGKLNFQAIATIQGARDAIPTDNTYISLATKVAK